LVVFRSGAALVDPIFIVVEDDVDHFVELDLNEFDIQLITPLAGCGGKADASSLFCFQSD